MTLIPTPVFAVRIFRGSSAPDLVRAYTEGQQKAIQNYAVETIQTCSTDWQHNPYVYAIVVETIADQEIIGGVRIHLAGPDISMPMEPAIRQYSPEAAAHLERFKQSSAAEICGIWKNPHLNDPKLSRFLTRSAIMQAQQLGVKYLFGFAGVHSIGLLEQEGFRYDEVFHPQIDLPYPDARYHSRFCYLPIPQRTLRLLPKVQTIRVGV